MPTLDQIIGGLIAKAKVATVKPAAEKPPDPRDDPWHYLDLNHGEQRLRDYLQRART